MEEQKEDLQTVTRRFSPEELDALVTQYTKQINPAALAYLAGRGIESKTVENYHIGFESANIGFHAGDKGMLKGYFSNRIIFPIVDTEGNVLDLVGRSIDNKHPKYRSLLGRTDMFFNHPALHVVEDVILVRNVFDALSVVQHNLPAVALPEGATFREQHAQALKEKRVFICYPNDESGCREALRIATMLEHAEIEVYMMYLPEGLRDVNDLFVRAKDPLDVFMNLLNEAISETLKMPVLPDARHLTAFTEEYAKRQKGLLTGIETGFTELDVKLLGGLQTGLYLVMGHVSIGKSMLLRQMADQIAAKGTPVVYVSWDMTAYELWCRSMARLMHVSPSEVLAGKVEMEKVSSATQQYADIARHMWTIEGTLEVTLQEVEEIVKRIAQSVGKAPVIFIDDLFRVALRDADGHIVYNNQAMNAYHLHQWTRQLHTPIVIAASSNGSQPGEIHPLVEAAVDTIIHVEATPSKTEVGDEVDDITLELTKNRNGGKGMVKLQFHKEKAEFFSSHS